MNWKLFNTIFYLLSLIFGIFSVSMGQISTPPMNFQGLLIILIVTPIGLLFITSIQVKNPLSDKIWEYPKWDKFPFNLKQPLNFFWFCSICSISHGIGSLIALPFSKKIIWEFFISWPIGIGLLFGVFLSVKIFNKRFKAAV